jgi:AhpD family alkylhydroperoxidase
MKALVASKITQESGLDHSLIDLVKTRLVINGCAYCIHMHTSEARAAESRGAPLSARVA